LRELISQLTKTKKVKTWLRGRRKGSGLATSTQLTVRALPARTAVSQGQSTVRPFLEKNSFDQILYSTFTTVSR
jgi:hypothetical protein